jgi:hypothetical protein
MLERIENITAEKKNIQLQNNSYDLKQYII